MLRGSLLLFFGALVAWPSGQPDSLDPAFEKVPFDRWLGEGDQGRFHWTAGVSRAELSFHQRLAARVEIKLDGRDLDTRREDTRREDTRHDKNHPGGKLVFLVQITDRLGTRYRNHGAIELSQLHENIKAANVEFSQRAIFLARGEATAGVLAWAVK